MIFLREKSVDPVEQRKWHVLEAPDSTEDKGDAQYKKQIDSVSLLSVINPP